MKNGKKKSLGYMEGKYINGAGKASKCCQPHKAIFNCEMFGTFNVKLKNDNIFDFQPVIINDVKSYWFVEITKTKETRYGWAIRDHTSKQAQNVLEIITKEKLPERFKQGNVKINIYERWSDAIIKNWSAKQYWFQTFPFSAAQKADSNFVWNTINKINWSGLSVYDIGCHYGFFSFKASECGARVVGMEPNDTSLKAAKIIRDNIIHQDVGFIKEASNKQYDVILYLSVHHQLDPNYERLEKKIQELKSKTNKYLFVELIMPPMFPEKGAMTEKDIDKIVGGEILSRYKHNVRGNRKIYFIKKENNSND